MDSLIVEIMKAGWMCVRVLDVGRGENLMLENKGT
jgi:hypothetical protein